MKKKGRAVVYGLRFRLSALTLGQAGARILVRGEGLGFKVLGSRTLFGL